jgi:hypothetical protein
MLRITAILSVNGLGEFASVMLILKHSSKPISETQPDQTQPDQTTMKVLFDFHKKIGFREEHGRLLPCYLFLDPL